MFSQKTLYMSIAGLSAAASVYFWILSGQILWTNHLLNEPLPAQIIQWAIEETGSNQYALKAQYSLEKDGRLYYGNTLFETPLYLNEASAIQALETAAKCQWTAWSDGKNPAHSSLQKISPLNVLLRAIVSSCLFLNFAFFVGKMIWLSKKISHPIEKKL